MVSRQFSVTKAASAAQPDIAAHMTLDPGNLVFKDSSGILKLTRLTEKINYKNVSAFFIIRFTSHYSFLR